MTFCARRAAAWAVMYSKAMKRDSRLARLAALLHVGRDAADLGVGEMAHHAAQRRGLEEHVGVHDHHALGPVLRQDRPDAVVERVRLALAALLATQMEHRARILRHLRPHHVGRVIGAGIVDHVDAPRAGRVVDAHQRIDAGAQHVGLVPCRQQEGHARGDVAAFGIVVADTVKANAPGTGRTWPVSAPCPAGRKADKGRSGHPASSSACADRLRGRWSA